MAKTVSLWLAVAAALRFAPAHIAAREARVGLALFGAIVPWSQFSILFNDLIDAEQDAAAGKRRWIQLVARPIGWAVVALLPTIGVLVLVVCGAPALVLCSYAAAMLVAALYSLPPLRLKERGAWGLIAYGGSTALAFALAPWLWLAPGVWAAGALVCAAVLLDKAVILLFHQIVDYPADHKARVGTYAVRSGLRRARRRLRMVSLPAGLFFLGLAGALARPGNTHLLWLPVAMPLLALPLLLLRRDRGEPSPASTHRLSAEMPLLYLAGSAILFRALPLSLLVRFSLAEPAFVPVAGLVAATVLLEAFHAVRYRYE